MMRIICAVEGFSGILRYFPNLYSRCEQCRVTHTCIVQVPIYIFSLQGIYLCVAIAFMNFTHIFYDGTLAIPLVGPSVQFLPKGGRDIIYQ
ncbi:hypothetical protein PENTCL1PPCAC_15320, partial [Pristionchus entomophagus]